MSSGPRAAPPFQSIDVNAPPMRITHHHSTTIAFGKLFTVIDHSAAMTVTAAQLISTSVATLVPLATVVPMVVITAGLHQFEQPRILILPKHPLVVGTGKHMPKMSNDIVRHEQISMTIVVHSPGIRGPVADDLELVTHRMKTPDAAIHDNPI